MNNRHRRHQSGAVAIEYGLIAALIVVVIISGISNLGDSTNGMYGMITNKVGNAMAR
jgi:pilus assembly protein Flp/PilA